MDWLPGMIVVVLLFAALIALIVVLQRGDMHEKATLTQNYSYKLYTKYWLPLVTRLEKEGNRQALDVLADVLEQAKTEVCADQALLRIVFGYRYRNDLTIDRFSALPKEQQIESVLTVGFGDVRKSELYCVSLSESIPCTDALTLLAIAEADPEARIQTVDAGDRADPGVLQRTVDLLAPCNPDWKCSVGAYGADGVQKDD